jgi:hypothetical protein
MPGYDRSHRGSYLLAAAFLLGLASPACTPATPSPVPSSTPTPTSSATPSPSPTATATATPSPTPDLATPLSPAPAVASLSIVDENKKPGTTDWRVRAAVLRAGAGDIAGFADAPSVDVGGTIHLAISTRVEGGSFSLEIFRLGWYGGLGARSVFRAEKLTGHAQGYWNAETIGVADCPTCETDPTTGLLDTHWRYDYSITIPADWISGEYLVRLRTASGGNGFIVFVVRQDGRASDLLVQMPVNTYQAYNKWGGTSLYVSDPRLATALSGGKPAVKVSFNRPYANLAPPRISADIQLIHFLEKNGYDATYTTSVDVDRDPSTLQGHRAFISAGHDEYWTRTMREAVEQARDAGLNLAFFGGNDVYWQARYEPDGDGSPRRVLVVYRRADLDPLAATAPADATVRFVDPPLSWPQNTLTGTNFGGLIEAPWGLPWVVAPTAPAWMLRGTGLEPGDSVPGLTGNECDSVPAAGPQPPGLTVVAASPMTTKDGADITCNSTYYRTSSGSAVFNAGTISWTASLDSFGYHNPGQHPDSHIVRLVMNLLASFGAKPAR